MPTKNNKNNKLIQKNNFSVPDSVANDIVVKKRGRPAGSKNKVTTTRLDSTTNGKVPLEDRKRMLAFNNVLLRLKKVNDRNDFTEINERVSYYLSLCEQYSLLPTVASFALSLGIDRVTLWTWINNKNDVIKNTEVLNLLKSVYSSINAQYESLLTEGKIIPVSGFFMLQNNYGYKNTTDHVITTAQDNTDSIADISNRANLMED